MTLISNLNFHRGVSLLRQRTSGRPDVKIAILDGPVRTDLSCFDKVNFECLPGYSNSFYSDGQATEHGTAVASIIWSDGWSATGIAPNCSGLICPIISDSPNRATRFLSLMRQQPQASKALEATSCCQAQATLQFRHPTVVVAAVKKRTGRDAPAGNKSVLRLFMR
jgi:hypothetical protein